MAVPGVAATPGLSIEDARRLLERTVAVLRRVIQSEPEEPLGRMQVGVISRLHNDVRDALSG